LHEGRKRVALGRMNTPRARRRWWPLGLLGLALALAGGCTKTAHYWQALNPFSSKINILIWDGYFSEDIIAKFEKDYGIEVVATTFSSNADLYEVLAGHDPTRKGPYDLAMPSSFMAERLEEERMLVPFTRLKGDTRFAVMTNLNPTNAFEQPEMVSRPSSLDRSYNPKSDPNNDFILPYIWGATGIGYNAEEVAHLPMSWGSLFDADPAHKKRIVLMDDSHFAIGPALIYQIAQKYQHSNLGTHEVAQLVASDFAAAGEKEIRAAGELVKSLGDQVVCINSDHVPELLATGVADMAIAWSGDVAVAMLRGRVDPPANQPPVIAPNLNIRISLPVEGVIVFRDCFVIPRGRVNQAGAEKFLNYLFEPEIAGAVTNYCCYATTVRSATPIVLPEISNSAAYFIHPYRDKNIFLENGHVRETDEIYNRVWDDVKKSFPPGVFKYPPEIPRDIAPPEPYPLVTPITAH
jgi:spermidine/putrescine-binding protein